MASHAGSCYVTTPIYYVNDVPHIGHAYTTVVCDVLARFMRLAGAEVRFVTGTDEHGQKVEKAAQNHGISPIIFCDKNSAIFRKLADSLDVRYDDFIRTTEGRHKAAVTSLWQLLVDNKQIYSSSYAGWYSVRDEAFYQEKELINGKAPTGAEVEWVEEPSYFFQLSKWQEQLLQFYEENPSFILPMQRRNEVISFVKSGLKDLSISRTNFNWGISVPGDSKHVIYVWVDALTNYLTGVGFPDTEGFNYRQYWNNCRVVHVVGKDILRFHAVYWPAILMAAGLPLPKQVIAHGWWMNDGQKMSKSIGNVIDPFKLIDEFGVDQVRYFMMREMPLGSDGNFSEASLVSRINSELSNNIGNLIQRTISFLHRECAGVVPNVDVDAFTGEDALPDYQKIYDAAMKNILVYEFGEIISLVLALSSAANEYIDRRAPWKLSKTNRQLMLVVIYKILEYVRCIGLLLQPIMPAASAKILDQLLVPVSERSLVNLQTSKVVAGSVLPKPSPIFPRQVDLKWGVNR